MGNATKREASVWVRGVSGSGKTTLVHRVIQGQFAQVIPTIGYVVDTFEDTNTTYKLWQVGKEEPRALWRHHLAGTSAVIYVVDSADAEALPQAAKDLRDILSEDELRHAALLVFAHKQDLPAALPASAIAEQLQLSSLRDRTWTIVASSAISGDGLAAGFTWLAKNLPPPSSS